MEEPPSYAYLGRISRAYCDLSGMFDKWSQYAKSMWVVEHPADDSVKRTHCHIFIYNSEATIKKLKDLKCWKDMKFNGNSDSSFKTYNAVNDIAHSEWFSCVAYMSKGKFNASFMKGDNCSVIYDLSKSNWVEPTPQNELVNVEIVRSLKKTNYDFGRDVVNRYADEYPDDVANDKVNVDIIIRITGEVLRANKRGRNYRNTANVAQDALADLDPTRWHSRVKSLM